MSKLKEHVRIRHIIPADGWRARLYGVNGTRLADLPVVAWALTHNEELDVDYVDALVLVPGLNATPEPLMELDRFGASEVTDHELRYGRSFSYERVDGEL